MFWVRDIIDTASDCDHFEMTSLVQWKVIVTRLVLERPKSRSLRKMVYVSMILGIINYGKVLKADFVCAQKSEKKE